MGEKRIICSNIKYAGKERTIARKYEDGIVTDVAIISGKNRFVVAEATLLEKEQMKKIDNRQRYANQIRELIETEKIPLYKIAERIKISAGYCTQIMYMFEIENKYAANNKKNTYKEIA